MKAIRVGFGAAVCLTIFSGITAWGSPAPITFDQYLLQLEYAGASDIDEAISLLPEDLRANFTLVYQGGGLRETSMEKPAALLFGLNGKFVVTFNSADQRTGNTLEFLAYDDSRDRFEMYELEFPLRKTAGGQIVKPEKNPARCLSCHQQDPRPIWGPYESFARQVTWHGVYGSAGDKLNRTERAGYQKFLATTAKGERFRHLIFPKGSSDSPYAVEDKGHLQFRPNTRYTSLVGRLTARRIARMLMESPLYAQGRHGLLYSLLHCNNLRGREGLTREDDLAQWITALGVRPIDFSGTHGETLPIGNYNDGVYDLSLRNLVGNLILKEIASRDPELAAHVRDLRIVDYLVFEELDSSSDLAFDREGDEIALLPFGAEPRTGYWRPREICEIPKDRLTRR